MGGIIYIMYVYYLFIILGVFVLLVVCMLGLVLCMSCVLVGCVGVGVVVVRSGYLLGHMYVGAGLSPVLRSSLACIEIVSCCFRVVSLSLRLNCNMLAGHVLLSIIATLLVAVFCLLPTLVMFLVVMGVCGVFGVLKVLTCVIQADVLVRLLGIYWTE